MKWIDVEIRNTKADKCMRGQELDEGKWNDVISKMFPNLAKKESNPVVNIRSCLFVVAQSTRFRECKSKKYLNASFHIYIIMFLPASVKTSLAWFS